MERASEESKADVNFILDEIGSHPGGSKSDRRGGQIWIGGYKDLNICLAAMLFIICMTFDGEYLGSDPTKI